jgi:citrate/tricarballylate utilization protein
MQQLESLAEQAIQFMPRSAVALTPEETEVDRVMTVCNACRYCEGFCAVFPAMTRLLEFGKADIHHLANVCHNCGACLHSCQYAPPHEFALNVPQALAKARAQTYTEYAWPPALGSLYRRAGLTVALSTAGALAFFLVLALQLSGTLLHEPLAGNFYAIFPHNMLALMFGVVFLFSVLALAIGVRRFWRDISPAGPAVSREAAAEAARNALTLKYLDGGHGNGCNDEDDRYTLRRRISPSMDSCFALQRPRSPRCTITSWTITRPTPS